MDADVAIVGGSFAGLACAGAAAARGLSVWCGDQRPEPGAHVRTTGLLVKELVEAWDVPPALTRAITGVRLYARSGRHVDLASPGYFFSATDAPALLRWLAARAAALGARCAWGAQVRGVARTADGWRLDGPAVQARFLVGADGPNSRVAAWCGLGRNRVFLCGAEAEVVGVRGLPPDRLHCFLDRRLAPGYLGWVVPGVGVTQVGLACRRGVRPDLAAMLARAAARFDFGHARVVARRGGLIPVGGPVRPVAAPGVLLVGDAAGHVSPLTAGGIHRAWRHGRAAAHAIADHRLAGGPPPHVVVARAQPWSPWKRWLRRAADWGPPDWLVDALLATRPMRALAATIFFHSRGLRSPAAWRDIATCLFTGRAARL